MEVVEGEERGIRAKRAMAALSPRFSSSFAPREEGGRRRRRDLKEKEGRALFTPNLKLSFPLASSSSCEQKLDRTGRAAVLLEEARMSLGLAALREQDPLRALSIYSKVKTPNSALNQSQVRIYVYMYVHTHVRTYMYISAQTNIVQTLCDNVLR